MWIIFCYIANQSRGYGEKCLDCLAFFEQMTICEGEMSLLSLVFFGKNYVK